MADWTAEVWHRYMNNIFSYLIFIHSKLAFQEMFKDNWHDDNVHQDKHYLTKLFNSWNYWMRYFTQYVVQESHIIVISTMNNKYTKTVITFWCLSIVGFIDQIKYIKPQTASTVDIHLYGQ